MNAELIEKTEDEYEEFLDEIYEPVEICGYMMNQGRILRELDPIAFRCGITDLDEEWQCDECNSVYDNKDEAENCCKEN